MKLFTIIANDPPYGTEKTWNALRLAEALLATGAKINVFLLGDAVSAGKKGQSVPKGYYNLEEMLKKLKEKGVTIKTCGTCISARGIKDEELAEGVERGKMMDLARWCVESDEVLTF